MVKWTKNRSSIDSDKLRETITNKIHLYVIHCLFERNLECLFSFKHFLAFFLIENLWFKFSFQLALIWPARAGAGWLDLFLLFSVSSHSPLPSDCGLLLGNMTFWCPIGPDNIGTYCHIVSRLSGHHSGPNCLGALYFHSYGRCVSGFH